MSIRLLQTTTADEDIESQGRAEVAHLHFELEEDIGAEIEDTVLFRRLGFFEDALDIIDNVLCRHLYLFPVFAEVTAFLTQRRDIGRLRDSLSWLRTQSTPHHHNWNFKEELYHERVVAFIQRKAVPEVDYAELDLEPVWLQTLELSLYRESRKLLDPSEKSFQQILQCFEKLMENDLHWDAVCIFKMLCEKYPVTMFDHADPKLILNLYSKIETHVSAADRVGRTKTDLEPSLPFLLTALSAKAAMMLYIVRIYEAEVEVLIKFVRAGIPPLRKVKDEAYEILVVLSSYLGYDHTRSIYHSFCQACMNYWKHSERAADTVHRLNKQIQKFNDRLRSKASKTNEPIVFSSYIPRLNPKPIGEWLFDPPSASLTELVQ